MSTSTWIVADFKTLRAWVDKHKLSPHRVVIGEFGALRPPPEAKSPDDGSRARWFETVRKAAESHGFGWALYAYHSDFGLIVDDDKAAWDASLAKALGVQLK
jgi:endoglucanase